MKRLLRHCQLSRVCSDLSAIILEHSALLNLTQQFSSKRSLATPQSVGVAVRDIVLHSVDVVLGESVLEWVQMLRESVALALET